MISVVNSFRERLENVNKIKDGKALIGVSVIHLLKLDLNHFLKQFN